MPEESTSNSGDTLGCVVRALVLYSLAEFQSGHCTAIRVDAGKDSFSISDDGRGHAIDRTVAESPYLQFVYTHLEYPFVPPRAAPIQLHGIGMSLINALCSDLAVTIRKPTETLRIFFKNGSLCDQELSEATSEGTGNTITGTVNPQFSHNFDGRALEHWLHGIKVSAPPLRLHFNGQEIRADVQSDA